MKSDIIFSAQCKICEGIVCFYILLEKEVTVPNEVDFDNYDDLKTDADDPNFDY